jgi:hypothetical protein
MGPLVSASQYERVRGYVQVRWLFARRSVCAARRACVHIIDSQRAITRRRGLTRARCC